MESPQSLPKLRAPQAARYIGLSVSTLAKMRLRGDGPPYAKAGPRVVVYGALEIEAVAVVVSDQVEMPAVARKNNWHTRGHRFHGHQIGTAFASIWENRDINFVHQCGDGGAEDHADVVKGCVWKPVLRQPSVEVEHLVGTDIGCAVDMLGSVEVIDRKAAENDYQVNIKAELEIELLHQKIDELRETEVLSLTKAVQELAALLNSEKRERGDLPAAAP